MTPYASESLHVMGEDIHKRKATYRKKPTDAFTPSHFAFLGEMMGQHKKPFGSTTPQWAAENERDVREWCGRALAYDPQHLQEFAAAFNAYNVERVLRGWSLLSDRAFAGFLRNLDFEFRKMPDTRRQGIVGYRLKG